MNIPKDPFMLLSVINTELRDHYASLDELCSANNLNKSEIIEKLSAAGFDYNPALNAFR